MAVQTFNIAAAGDDAAFTILISSGAFTTWNSAAAFFSLGKGSNGAVGLGGWFRFTNVTVAQGTIISSAVIRLNNDSIGNPGSAAQIIFHCEDADNPTMPTSTADAASRSLTAGVPFSPTPTTGLYDFDITSIVQAIINRGGFASGNAISVVCKDNGSNTNNSIRCRNYEHDPAEAAQLIITTAAAPIVAEVPTGSVSIAGIAPTVRRAAATGQGTVAITGQAPAVAKSAPVPAGSVSIVGIAPTSPISAAVGAGLVSIEGVSPATAKAVGVPAGSVSIVGASPATAKQAEVGTGEVTITGTSPTAAKSVTIAAGSVTIQGGDVATAKAASVPAGSVAIIGIPPVVTGGGEIEPGVVSIIGIAPDTAKAATIAAGLVTITGIAPVGRIGAILVALGRVDVFPAAAGWVETTPLTLGKCTIAPFAGWIETTPATLGEVELTKHAGHQETLP